MKLGQPQHLLDQSSGGYTDRLRLKEGENIHRVLFGPMKVQYIYYPTMEFDPESGGDKQKLKVVKRPPEGCVLDNFASFEKATRKKMGEEKPKSQLSPSSKWLYLVINKSEEEPKIEIAEYPYSVFDSIRKLEAALSKKNENKLRYGLCFMYDIIITKSVDPNKPRQYGTSYTVEVDPENTYAGKVPASYLGKTSDDLAELGVKVEKFFTKKELEVIEEYDATDFEKEAEPDSPDDIIAKLNESPLFLGARDNNGKFIFPSKDDMAKIAEQYGVNFFMSPDSSQSPKSASKALEPPKKGATFEELEEAAGEEAHGEMPFDDGPQDEPEEAEYEEEEEETPKPKKKPKSKSKPKSKPKPEPEEEEEEEEEEDEGEEFPNW